MKWGGLGVVWRWLLALGVQWVLMMGSVDVWRESVGRGYPAFEGWGLQCHLFPEPLAPPYAARVVLFVVGGLRAESGWHFRGARGGVALADEPVSKRRGHLAILSGASSPPPLHIPVHPSPTYDTLFNQLEGSFIFAADKQVEEIIMNFSLTEDYIMKFVYPHTIPLNFFSDTTASDKWVFNSISKVMADPNMESSLRGNRKLFYVQLSSVDLASQIEGYLSWRTESNIRFIHGEVKKLMAMFEDYYKDNATCYILTSDSGSETDGGLMDGEVKRKDSMERRRTPFLAWGAGISPSAEPFDWNSSLNLDKYDLHQIDIAPLVAHILGAYIPIHSEGFIPEEFVDFVPVDLAASCFCNAVQVSTLFLSSREKFINDSLFVYRSNNPYATNWVPIVEYQLNESFLSEEYEKTVNTSRKLAIAALAGLNFNRIYFRQILIMLLMFIIIFWVLLLFSSPMVRNPQLVAVNEGEEPERNENRLNVKGVVLIKKIVRESPGRVASDLMFFLLFVMSFVIVYVENWPIRFYIYNSLPVVIFWFLFNNLLQAGVNGAEELKKVLCAAVFYVAIVQCLTWFLDGPLSMYILMTLFYLLTVLYDFREVPMVRVRDWMLTPLVPQVLLFFSNSQPSQSALFLYVVLWVAVTVVHEFWFKWKKENSTVLLVATFAMAGVVSRWLLSDCTNPITGETVEWCPKSNNNEYYISWLAFTPLLLTRFVGSDNFITRLVEVTLSLGVPYFLFSTRLEPVALLLMALHTFCWLVLENSEKKTLAEMGDLSIRERTRAGPDAQGETKGVMMRRGFHIVVYLVVAYLCTGHSADVPPVRLTWFDEYIPPEVKGYLTLTLLTKHLVMVLTLVSYFVVLVRISGGVLEPHLTFALFFANSMLLQTSVKFILLPYSEKDFAPYLSAHLLCLALPVYILISAPLAVLLTGPSFFIRSKTNRQELIDKDQSNSEPNLRQV